MCVFQRSVCLERNRGRVSRKRKSVSRDRAIAGAIHARCLAEQPAAQLVEQHGTQHRPAPPSLSLSLSPPLEMSEGRMTAFQTARVFPFATRAGRVGGPAASARRATRPHAKPESLRYSFEEQKRERERERPVCALAELASFVTRWRVGAGVRPCGAAVGARRALASPVCALLPTTRRRLRPTTRLAI